MYHVLVIIMYWYDIMVLYVCVCVRIIYEVIHHVKIRGTTDDRLPTTDHQRNAQCSG